MPLSEELREISAGMLEKDPLKRFSSADKFARDFASIRKKHYPNAQEELTEIMQQVFADKIISEAQERKELWNKEEEKREKTQEYVPEKLSKKNLSDSSQSHQVVKLDAKSYKETSDISFLNDVGPFKKK